MSLERSIFDHDWVRFCTCGSLLTLRCLADWANRRRGRRGAPSPRWMHVLLTVTLLVFYGFIRPAGSALVSGAGNLVGIGAALMALAIEGIGPPPLALVVGRALFYLALPIAVGVPWGLAVLSLPVLAGMAWTMRDAALQPAENPTRI
jgi:hypothetical protein